MRRLCVALVLASLACGGSAQVAWPESGHRLLTKDTERQIERLPDDDLSVPLPPGRAVVLVRVAGAQFEALVFGAPSVDPARYAAVLDEWRLGQGLAGFVTVSKEKNGVAARFQGGSYHFGARRLQSELPLGSLVKAVDRIEPLTGVWLIQSPGGPALLDSRDETWRRESLWRVDQGRSTPASLTLKSDLTSWQVGLTLFLLALPVVSGIAAGWFSRRELVTAKGDQPERPQAMEVSCFAFYFATIAAAFANIVPFTSPQNLLTAWLPVTAQVLADAVMAVPVLIGLLAMVPAVLQARRLMNRRDLPDSSIKTVRSFGVTCSSVLLMMIVLNVVSPWKLANILDPIGPPWAVAAIRFTSFLIVLLPCLVFAFGMVARTSHVTTAERAANNRVRTLGRPLLDRIGLKRKLKITSEQSSDPFALGFMSDEITLSHEAAEKLPDDELRFFLAHAIAHAHLGHLRKRWLWRIGYLLGAGAFIAAAFVSQFDGGVWSGVLCLLGVIFIGASWACLRELKERQDIAADRFALELTGDREAAERVVRQMVLKSVIPRDRAVRRAVPDDARHRLAALDSAETV